MSAFRYKSFSTSACGIIPTWVCEIDSTSACQMWDLICHNSFWHRVSVRLSVCRCLCYHHYANDMHPSHWWTVSLFYQFSYTLNSHKKYGKNQLTYTQHPTEIHTSNPWNKCPKRCILTTGGQIPIEKHYWSFEGNMIIASQWIVCL